MTNPQEQDNSTTAEFDSVAAAEVTTEAPQDAEATTDAPASEESAAVVEPTEEEKTAAADEAIKAEIRDLIAQIVVKIQAIKDQPSILKTLETALANSLKHF